MLGGGGGTFGTDEPALGDGGGQRLERALEAGYRYLNHRERTEAEVASHLAGKGFGQHVVDEALGTLRDDGYISDVRFARLFAHDKRELEHWGNERIRRALASRGIDREVAEQALAEEPGAAEVDRALDVLRRRFPAGAGDSRERERALGVLLRKGYDSDLALDAITHHTREADQRNLR